MGVQAVNQPLAGYCRIPPDVELAGVVCVVVGNDVGICVVVGAIVDEDFVVRVVSFAVEN